MELPQRARGDELLKGGELTSIRRRLRNIAPKHDLATVIACAFDHRTRMLPFIYADMWMAPAGVRAIGAAMVDAGFDKTRIVLQQWNRNFRPSQMRLDGRIPDIFMVSSMQIHSDRCNALIRDTWRIDSARRPLIIAGGPKVIYEPWGVFSPNADNPWGADVAVTGEEYVLLSLLEGLLSERSGRESLRQTFLRARDKGALDEIPGLVYARGGRDGVAEELVDTGIQRLVGDLDELPDTAIGYRLLEAPSRNPTLASEPLLPSRVRKHSPISSILMTCGCKFACPYCPIPAYNQRQHRVKSGARTGDEMRRLSSEFGFRYFCGVGGNFFDNRAWALDIIETLVRMAFNDSGRYDKIHWGTEATVYDTLQMKEHLGAAHDAGLRALWLGVEDMTGTLIRKGQSTQNTMEIFALLQAQGISPIPMLMHHDTQPLYTRRTPYGLLNQVRLLRKAGAVDLQVLMVTPAPGSKMYEQAFTSGLVYHSVGPKRVEPHMLGDNHVISSSHNKPWRKQLNIIATYLYFFNPLRLLGAFVRPKSKKCFVDAALQVIGMWGLVLTIRHTLGWAFRLMRSSIKRYTEVPTPRIPMRSVEGGPASHALPPSPASHPTRAAFKTKAAAVLSCS